MPEDEKTIRSLTGHPVGHQFSTHNPHPAGSLPGVVKPADGHFVTEMVANARVVNL